MSEEAKRLGLAVAHAMELAEETGAELKLEVSYSKRAEAVEEARRDAEVMDVVRSIRQQVHQAHHEGPMETCQQNTCTAAAGILGERP